MEGFVRRIVIIFFLLISYNLLQAQEAIRYPGLSDSLEVQLNNVVLPGVMEQAMSELVTLGLAIEDPGFWTIAVIDSVQFESGLTWHDIGGWGWIENSPGYPFKGDIAAKPTFIRFTNFSINKSTLEIDIGKRFRTDPARSFLRGTFAENTFPSREQAEERRIDMENKRKEKK